MNNLPVSSLQQEFDDLLSDYVQAIESVKNDIDKTEYELSLIHI